MTFPKMLAATLLTALAATAFAHTKLGGSVPADGARVEAPSELVLEFPEPVRLTAVTLRAAEGGPHPLGAIPDGPATKFTIPVTARLAAGDYRVTWRAIGADTHIVSGEFSFAVAPAD